MSNLTSIIIVAVLSVIGNIFYFEYRTQKVKSKDILKQRLTNLLLPLYVILHLEEFAVDAWARSGEGELAESHSDLPTRILSPIEKIIKENIYLADDELHEACVNFLQWAYGSDTNARYQDIMNGKFESAIQDKHFKTFYNIVIREYKNTKHEYLNK